jgi:hypothetical protein
MLISLTGEHTNILAGYFLFTSLLCLFLAIIWGKSNLLNISLKAIFIIIMLGNFVIFLKLINMI